VQQYNDLRENKFKYWKFDGKTWFPIVLMCAILPVGCYKMTKAELVCACNAWWFQVCA